MEESTVPVTSRPFCFCKSFTAKVVFLPKIPSIFPLYKPLSFKLCCNSFTSNPITLVEEDVTELSILNELPVPKLPVPKELPVVNEASTRIE